MSEQIRVFKNAQERDAYVESVYDYDREGHASTLAFVSAERVALAHAFMVWWPDHFMAEESPRAGLTRWQGYRFGAPLDEAPDGILWHEVRRALHEGLPAPRTAKVPPRRDGEGLLAYLERVAVVNNWMRAGTPVVHDMPEAEVA